MSDYHLELKFTVPGYIAHPYWVEREKLINIIKESGAKRLRSEAKAEQALTQYLKAKGISPEDYALLQAKADREWYTWASEPLGSTLFSTVPDSNGHDPNEIIIPGHQLYGMLANGCALASARLRPARREQVRSVIHMTSLATGKAHADGVYERFVVVTGAQGKLSNQRGLRSNDYISNFTATGLVRFSEHIVPRDKVWSFLEFCGDAIGVGACRKLGFGRFQVTAFEAV